MKKIVYVIISIITISSLIISCSPDSGSPSGDYFKITASNGKTFKTNYTNVPLPTKNGTFSLQYNKPTQDNKKHTFYFLILIDNNNDADLFIALPNLPVLNKTYKTASSIEQSISFNLYIDNEDTCSSGNCSSEITFTSFKYPGLIVGNVKRYSSTGKLIDSGEFNFTSK